MAIVAIVVAEVLVLGAIALSAQGRPVDGVQVRADQVALEVVPQRVFDGVTVDRVVTPVPAWVVVQADWGDGDPAQVIGYERVPAGESELVTVLLNKSEGMPTRVFVSLFADRGIQGEFEYFGPMLVAEEGKGMSMGGTTEESDEASGTVDEADKPQPGGMDSGIDKIMRVSGTDVSRAIEITPFSVGVAYGEAALEGVNRIQEGAVSVDRVLAPGPGWLVVSKAGVGPGGVGEIIGSTAVPAGESRSVEVAFDPPSVDDQLVASLHADLGRRGVLEFDSSLGAVTIDQVFFMELSMMSVSVPPLATP